MVAERENNDTIATAQEINLGFDVGEVQTLTVNGRLSAPPPLPSSDTINQIEENGSIPTAQSTGIYAGGSVATNVLSILSSSQPDGSGADTDLYKVSSGAGQLLTIEAIGIGSFDPSIFIYDETGAIIAFNVDRSASDTDSFLEFVIPVEGDYYVSVQHFSVLQFDPFDPDSAIALLNDSSGGVLLTISQTTPDVDHYSVELNAGDIIGAGVDRAGTSLSFYDPTGQLILGTNQNLSQIFSDQSPLAGDASDNASGGFVATTAGTYTIAVAGDAGGAYSLDTSIHRPTLEQQPGRSVQTFYLDFDGARVDRSSFDISLSGTATLSGLSDFLTDWGLRSRDEDAVIDAIIAEFERLLVTDIAAQGGNPDFEIQVLNSRDHGEIVNSQNVSRVIIGGTNDQIALNTIGAAQHIDVGNFDTTDEAIVLLDSLSAPADDPNSTNSIQRAGSVSKIDAVGTVVGSTAAHEAAHLLGVLHANPLNDTFSANDSGGVYLYPVGNDGILGTADDPDLLFTTDSLSGREGTFGTQNAADIISFAATSKDGPGFNYLVSENRLVYLGDETDDRITIYGNGQDEIESYVDGIAGAVVAPNTATIEIEAFGGDNRIFAGGLGSLVDNDIVVTTGDGNDIVNVGNGTNTVFTGAGDDTISSDGGGVLDAGDGIEHIRSGFCWLRRCG